MGEYHKGWRAILLKGVGSIDNISVVDKDTGEVYKKVSSTLDKTDPKSWGKYTTYAENGHQNIEWYYNLKDTSHTFTLKYRLHGAIGFFNDRDELYWNLATEYGVPIKHIEATVVLPSNVSSDKLYGYFYDDQMPALGVSPRDGTHIYFSKDNMSPREQVTIAVGWPKGVVSHTGYWADILRSFWGWIIGVLVLAVTICWAVYYQTIGEQRQGRGTVIPEYEPPEDLPPAMAEVLVKEHITLMAWPATIIDLAVRGFLRVSEDPQPKPSLMGIILPILAVTLCAFFVYWSNDYVLFGIIPIMLAIFTWRFMSTTDEGRKFLRDHLSFHTQKEYLLTRINGSNEKLKSYEIEFLSILSLSKEGDIFSTKKLKVDLEASRSIALAMVELQVTLDKETDGVTQAYEHPHTSKVENIIFYSAMVFLAMLIIIPGFSGMIFSSQFGVIVFLGYIAMAIVHTAIYSKRLNTRGELLKEDWLGFKMYLETAERYRMQNLTPEIFEKYLPYAMIFGIEKK